MDKKEGFKRMKEASGGRTKGSGEADFRSKSSRGASTRSAGSGGSGSRGTGSGGSGSGGTGARGIGFSGAGSRGTGSGGTGSRGNGFYGERKARGTAGAGTGKPGAKRQGIGGTSSGRSYDSGRQDFGESGNAGTNSYRPSSGRTGAISEKSYGTGRTGAGEQGKSRTGSYRLGSGKPGSASAGTRRSASGGPASGRTRSSRTSGQRRPSWDKPLSERPTKARPDKVRINNEFRDEPDDSGILEGRNPVMEALKSGRSINRLIVSSGEREGSIGKIISMGREKGIVIQEVEKSRLDFLSITGAHQGVIAYVSPKDYVEVSALLEKAAQKAEEPFIIILDGITDPHNLGSTIRTADAVGVHGIIIPKRRAVALNATVAKASAGALEYVDVARVTNLSQTIQELKENNIWVVGTDSSAETSFDEVDFKRPVALVIGGEGEGIGRLVKEKCDYVVNIPMKGGVSSLNASVAAAIMMYEVHRQRNR